MEPIPESPPVLVLPKSTRNRLTEDGTPQIPLEEFERDLESDEVPVVSSDFEEFIQSSFVNVRRGGIDRNRVGFAIDEDSMSGTSEQLGLMTPAASLERMTKAVSLDQVTPAPSFEQTKVVSMGQATLASSFEQTTKAVSMHQATPAASFEQTKAIIMEQATQTEQSLNTNFEAASNCCCTGVVHSMQSLDVSCRTSPAPNSKMDLSWGSVAGETPPHMIRANLKELQKEYEELRELTTLERQIFAEGDKASTSVQTETPYSTRDTKVSLAPQEEQLLLPGSNEGVEECPDSLLQLRSEIDLLTAENRALRLCGGCRCEELEKENKQLIQEAVTRRCKIAQLQEEVENQEKLIKSINSELEEARHKIRVYKMEWKQLQRADRTSSQITKSRMCDATSQTDDARMFINYGSGIVTEMLAENLRMTVFDLKKKNEKMKNIYLAQADKVSMLENKITELRGEKKTYCNARVQTENQQQVCFSNKDIQVDLFPLNASQREIGQILFWKSRAEQHLEQKKFQIKLCALLRGEIEELKKKPEPLAVRDLSYKLHDKQ